MVDFCFGYHIIRQKPSACFSITHVKFASDFSFSYPSSEYKKRLAIGIVADFPNLSSAIPGRSYESFFDPKTGEGYLTHRLRTVRKGQDESQKRRIRKRVYRRRDPIASSVPGIAAHPSEVALSDVELHQKIAEMGKKAATDDAKNDIRKLMKETRSNRTKEIKERLCTGSEILYKYIHLQSYNGEMIDEEFHALFEKHDVFLAKFPSYFAPRILKLSEDSLLAPERYDALQNVEVSLKALLILPDMLPSPNHFQGKRFTKDSGKKPKPLDSSASHLLRFIQENEDFSEASKPLPDQNYPFLVVCSTDGVQNENPFYLRFNESLFPVGQMPMAAFDRLFKLYFLLNLEYPPALFYFYNFIQACVYGLANPKSCCDSLLTRLSNAQVQDLTGLEEEPTEEDIKPW